MNRDPEPASSPDGPPAAQPGKGFKARKREDHALILIEELRGTLSDLSRVKRILIELGRYYDPVLGGSIMDIPHQRQIVAALEAGRTEAAQALIEARYALYIKDRAHLGRREED
jgi:hypothetical protein